MEVESRQMESLEQFCLLAKSARGRGLVELVTRATSDPNLFAFGELLDVPQIKELAGSEHAAALAVLRLFAYGTWAQYRENSSSLPALQPAQQLKLKQLTVMTLAEGSKVLPYSLLMEQLDISNVRELEDLLINDCMYAGILKGRLDQRSRCVEVQFAAGRDLRPGQLGDILSTLSAWLSNSEAMLGTIEERIRWADLQGEQRSKHRKDVEERAEEMKKTIWSEMEMRGPEAMYVEGGSAAVGGASGGMDYVGDMERSKPKRRR
eukprot:TRINITY_DN10438_c0_g1_i1.p1 TRINITY_DN10438_c0_g1~~TRINITY_DN10438_c0_g1_i1.p1  ORF type:complete len:264 (+),score=3.70 TRINITY_DN10438_c0_g1_i1:224-1015(+)